MDAPSFNLGTVLLFGTGLFVLATLFYDTKGGHYQGLLEVILSVSPPLVSSPAASATP